MDNIHAMLKLSTLYLKILQKGQKYNVFWLKNNQYCNILFKMPVLCAILQNKILTLVVFGKSQSQRLAISVPNCHTAVAYMRLLL